MTKYQFVDISLRIFLRDFLTSECSIVESSDTSSSIEKDLHQNQNFSYLQ